MNWRILVLWLSLLLAGCEVRDEVHMIAVADVGKTARIGKPETVAVTTRRFPSELFFKAKPKPQLIPADFPLGLYPGAELLDVIKHPSFGQTEVFAEIEPIKNSPKVIADFYRKKLQTTGWTIKPRDKHTVTPDQEEIPAIRGKESITVIIWDHEHDHEPDFSTIDNWKRRNTRATTIWIDLYGLDHDAQ